MCSQRRKASQLLYGPIVNIIRSETKVLLAALARKREGTHLFAAGQESWLLHPVGCDGDDSALWFHYCVAVDAVANLARQQHERRVAGARRHLHGAEKPMSVDMTREYKTSSTRLYRAEVSGLRIEDGCWWSEEEGTCFACSVASSSMREGREGCCLT